MKSDTDSDSIRTGFRRMSDSVPEFAGQLLGAKRRLGSSTTLWKFASQARRQELSVGGAVLGRVGGQEARSPMGVAPLRTGASSTSARGPQRSVPGPHEGGGLPAHNGRLDLRGGFGFRRSFVTAIGGDARLAHRLALEFHPIGLVHQPIHQGIGDGRVAHQFVPLAHGELAGDEYRTFPQPVVDDLEQFPIWLGARRGESEIVDDQQRDARPLFESSGEGSVGLSQLQIPKQFRGVVIQSAVSVTTGLMPQAQAR